MKLLKQNQLFPLFLLFCSCYVTLEYPNWRTSIIYIYVGFVPPFFLTDNVPNWEGGRRGRN